MTRPTEADASAADHRTALPSRSRWCRATWALVGTATVWLLVVLVTRLFSGRWWLLVPLDFPPSLAYVTVPVMLLAAIPLVRVIRTPIPMRPRLLIVAVALADLILALPVSGLDPAALGRTGNPPPTDAIRVFAWNTEYWDQGDDPEQFLNFLTAQHADIYLLQEYIDWDEAAYRALPIDRLAQLRSSFPGYSIAIRGELVTLSRFPIVAQPPVGPERALRSADFDEVFAASKVLRTDLRVDGRTLSVYNVHLPVYESVSPRGLPRTRERHANWQAQLDGLTGDIETNGLPVLVCGDFNAGPANAALRDFRARLRDAAVSAGSSPYPVSWHAGWPWAWWRLDWTLYSGAVRPYRYGFHDPAGLSDHRAQEFSISFAKLQ